MCGRACLIWARLSSILARSMLRWMALVAPLAFLLSTGAAVSPAAAPPAAAAPPPAVGASAAAPLAARAVARALPATLAHDPAATIRRARTASSICCWAICCFIRRTSWAPRRAAPGLSCHVCHPNGATNATLTIEGVSDRPGNVDLTTAHFRAGRRQPHRRSDQHAVAARCALHQPLRPRRPDRVAVRVRARRREQRVRRRAAAAGAAVGAGPLRAGSRLRPERQPRWARAADGARDASARRGEILFAHAAGRLRRRELRDLPRPHVVLSRRPGAPADVGASPSPHAIDDGFETPTLLGTAESAPYFHDGGSRRWPTWSPGSIARSRSACRRASAPI